MKQKNYPLHYKSRGRARAHVFGSCAHMHAPMWLDIWLMSILSFHDQSLKSVLVCENGGGDNPWMGGRDPPPILDSPAPCSVITILTILTLFMPQVFTQQLAGTKRVITERDGAIYNQSVSNIICCSCSLVKCGASVIAWWLGGV